MLVGAVALGVLVVCGVACQLWYCVYGDVDGRKMNSPGSSSKVRQASTSMVIGRSSAGKGKHRRLKTTEDSDDSEEEESEDEDEESEEQESEEDEKPRLQLQLDIDAWGMSNHPPSRQVAGKKIKR